MEAHMLYSVLIVDAKDYFRKATIQKLLRGYENLAIVGEAGDGDEALMKTESLQPDIVILDCQLSKIDGFTYIQQAMARHIYPHYILTSEYDNFSYVQRALRLGVHDYLLKPLNNAELYEAVQRACAAIESERRSFRTAAASSASLFLHRRTAWANAARSEMTNERLCRMMASNFSTPFPGLYFSFLAVRIGSDSPGNGNAPVLCYAVSAMLADVLSLRGTAQCFYFDDRPTDVYAIVNHLSDHPNLHALLDLAQRCMQSAFQASCVFALSAPVQHFSSLKEKCDSLRLLLDQSISLPGQQILQKQDLQALSDTPAGMRPEQLEELIRLVLNSGSLAESAVIPEFLDMLLENRLTHAAIAQSCAQLIRQVETELRRSCRHAARSGGDAGAHADGFLTCHTVSQFRARLIQQITRLSQQYEFNHLTAGKKVVAAILARLETEYCQNVRLSSYAAAYFINQSYLSELFQQETGVNYSQYLQNKRMTRATELLAQTNYPTGKIAEMVGYNDRNYFASVFSRVYGMTPVQYRESIKAGQ